MVMVKVHGNLGHDVRTKPIIMPTYALILKHFLKIKYKENENFPNFRKNVSWSKNVGVD